MKRNPWTTNVVSGLFFGLAATVPGRGGDLYWSGGTTDIADGTALPANSADLVGTWDKTTRNWATDENGTSYTVWQDGPTATAWLTPFTNDSGVATVTLSDDIQLNQLAAPHNASGSKGYNHTYSLTATQSRTISLAGDSPSIRTSTSDSTRKVFLQPNVRLAAPQGFSKTGIGLLYLYSECPDVAGTVTVEGGSLRVEATGALPNVGRFHVLNAAYAAFVVSLADGENDRIGDDAVVRLSGTGKFMPYGKAGATERLGQLVLDAAGVVELSSGGGEFILTDGTAGVDRGPDGHATLTFADTMATALVVSNGVPDGLLPWATTLASRPVGLNATTKVFEPLATTSAPADLSAWTSGNRYRVEGDFVPANAIPTLNIESLGIYNSNGNLTLPVSGDLTIASGQLSFNITGTGGSSRSLSGGSLTSGTGELYIMTGTSGANIGIYIKSAIVGDIDVIKSGSLGVYFNGTATNTYTGTTYVNGGKLELSGSTYYVVPGDVVVNRGASLYLQPSIDHIWTNALVTIREGGQISHNNSAVQTYGGRLTFEGGTLTLGGVGNGATIKGAGTGLVFANGGRIEQVNSGFTMGMKFLTDVRVEATSTNQAVVTTVNASQRLLLSTSATDPGTTRTFEVQDAVGLDATTPELLLDIPLECTVGIPVLLAKTGAGTLALERLSGRFFGDASVLGGTLLVNGPYATQSVVTVTTDAGYDTTVAISPSTDGLYVTQPLTGGGVRDNTWITAITDSTMVTLNQYGWNTGATVTRECVIPACGALGTGSVSVATGATLGGTGGVGGSVAVAAEGRLDPGTPADPVGRFQVGGTLDLGEGGILRSVRRPGGRGGRLGAGRGRPTDPSRRRPNADGRVDRRHVRRHRFGRNAGPERLSDRGRCGGANGLAEQDGPRDRPVPPLNGAHQRRVRDLRRVFRAVMVEDADGHGFRAKEHGALRHAPARTGPQYPGGPPRRKQDRARPCRRPLP